MANYLISCDFGTSGAKTTLFSEEGTLLKSSVGSYEVSYRNGNWAEENPSDWWKAACRTIQAVLREISPADVAAVSLSGQMSGALLLDKHMEVVRPHILWSDGRAWEEAEYIKNTVDLQAHFDKAGKMPGASRMLEKLMWVQKHEPEAYKRTSKVLQAKDFIAYMLTGEVCTDYSDASGSYLFDRETYRFSEELLSLGNISPSIMPEAVPSTQVIGKVTESAAVRTGLLAGTPVVIGAGDVPATTVGARCVEKNQMHFCIGSSGWCAVTMDHAFSDYTKSYSVLHPVDGLYVNQSTLAAAGISYKWLKQQLFPENEMSNDWDKVSDYEIMNRMAENTPAGSNGVMYLPYLLGDQSLYNNPNATGAFAGLTAAATRADMIRAVLEGVCYYLTASAEIYGKHVEIEGAPLLIGGAAKGEIWSRILSDMMGRPCMTSQYPEEATSIGAAIIGGVGVGLFKDIPTAAKVIKVNRETNPDMENHERYKRLREAFLEIYYGLEPFFLRLRG